MKYSSCKDSCLLKYNGDKDKRKVCKSYCKCKNKCNMSFSSKKCKKKCKEKKPFRVTARHCLQLRYHPRCHYFFI